MCQEVWYRFTCGHLIPARDNQEGWAHCDNWNQGENETDCPGYDQDADHETRDEPTRCQECEYATPPTSSEPSSDNDDGSGAGD